MIAVDNFFSSNLVFAIHFFVASLYRLLLDYPNIIFSYSISLQAVQQQKKNNLSVRESKIEMKDYSWLHVRFQSRWTPARLIDKLNGGFMLLVFYFCNAIRWTLTAMHATNVIHVSLVLIFLFFVMHFSAIILWNLLSKLTLTKNKNKKQKAHKIKQQSHWVWFFFNKIIFQRKQHQWRRIQWPFQSHKNIYQRNSQSSSEMETNKTVTF